MDSNYSAIRKSSSVELQSQDNFSSNDYFPSIIPRSSDKASVKLLPVSDRGDEETQNAKFNDNGDDGDDDDDDFLVSIDDVKNGSGIPGAVFNLATSIIGAGIMALPATMKVLGLALGFVLIIVMGILSEISIEMLVRFSVLHKAYSYGDVVQSTLGRRARILSEICIIINNTGVLVVYLIIMGDVMSGSSHHLGVLDQWLGNGFWDHRKLVILFIVVVFLAPLCALEKIDSLSVTSAASVALAIVFVLICCAIAFVKLVEGRIETPRITPDFGSKKAIIDLLVVIPIMTNAYICHFNVQPIYNELEGRSPQKMNRVGRITTLLCVVVYLSTAISGYLLFGRGTESDVLTNFDKDLGIHFSSVLNYIVRVGYIFHLVLVFPVIHFSLRQTVDALLFEGSGPLIGNRKRSLTLTAMLLGLTYFGSTMIPNIWTAFKFTGATTALSLGFIFPSLIALKSNHVGEILNQREKFLSWLMLILAVSVSVVGVIGNIYSIDGESG